MNPGIVSALAALSGSMIGGLTSLATSWVSNSVKARMQQTAADTARRQELYKAFVEEASKLYGEALTSDKAEIATLVSLYAMVGRMRILSSPPVIDAADKVVRLIVDTYFAPNKTLLDLRDVMKSSHIDPLQDFNEACREDVRAMRSR